ncbi:glycosyl transferase family 1 [Thiohalorhabdus denitrificans]|uniref:Glycosyltransferase involved in cell wall bisynthesis n=1 Tax=Thiohalorhabdus denitrificans TaxID=381306 RepID=A0A0P9ELU8_9GAMM|nr:glycosyltransferase family 4 protein [Thiohalorhabdus denitrificans]KPV39569.1 glycosyl transferase family 1 [Thiohalorhabdus denitrificans]SCX98316.1 Glycosyltransferase involved in cell wall bisynthesis [Thiohalorhabdus denitrificans]
MAEGPKVLFLTKYARKGASSRYRTFQFLPYLEAAGFRCTVSPLFDDSYLAHKYSSGRARWRDVVGAFGGRLRAILGSRRFDLVVIEKELLPYSPALLERLLGWAGVPYVVDYDDALFHQYDRHPRPWVRWLLGRKIARVMRGAALVTAGNEYLAGYARRAGAPRVEVLPTVVDLDRYPAPAGPGGNAVFTIGWIGSPTTAQYLEKIAPALARVCADGQARVRLIGSGKVDLPGVPHEVIPWREGEEAEQLRAMDVGIMPLPDTPWERGKCGFKLIQYMACGLPVVASPVGVNADIVEDGINGYLAGDEEAWVAALNRLKGEPERRQEFGKAGRSKVEGEYSLEVTAPRFARLLWEQCSDSP